MRTFRPFVLMSLLLTVLTLAACSSSKPEAAVQQFYRAVEKGQIDKAIEHFSFADVSADSMVQAKGKVQMVVGEMKSRIDANDGLDKVEVLESNIDEGGQTARVRVRLVFGNGKDTTESHRMRRDDGKWKIVLR